MAVRAVADSIIEMCEPARLLYWLYLGSSVANCPFASRAFSKTKEPLRVAVSPLTEGSELKVTAIRTLISIISNENALISTESPATTSAGRILQDK